LRASQPQAEVELIFDVGPLGLMPHAAHGHADALSVMVRLDGRFLLTDPGTGAYFHSALLRNVFRRTAAHNTVTVDGLDQADVFDLFKWVNPVEARLQASYLSEHFDYLCALHHGYHRLRDAVTHTRTVLFVRPDAWLIVDRLEGQGQHEFAQHFHFPPDINVKQLTPHEVIAVDQVSGNGLQLGFAHVAAKTARLRLDHQGGWSDRYGHWESAYRVRVEATAQAPQTFLTLIRPMRVPSATGVVSRYQVETVEGGQAMLYRREQMSPDIESWVLVNPRQLSVALPHGWRSNAAFLYLAKRLGYDGFERVFLTGKGSFFEGAAVRWTCTAAEPFIGYQR